jgi:predicted P-loop ATPase
MELAAFTLQHDGKVIIAVGENRNSKQWKRQELKWSQLVVRLSQTKRTSETFAEFMAMPKQQQDNIKDVGGFVGGVLKGGRRKRDAVAWRHICVLDADFAEADFIETVKAKFPNAFAIHTTHKHCTETPRYRFLFPFTRAVTPEECPAIARRIAADIGIDFFDDTTYQVHRLMYWPSTAVDGDFDFEYQDAEFIDPDAVLARYDDWRDVSQWPESSRMHTERRQIADRQGDPLAKSGVVGAFCRAYTVSAAIDTFLSGVYEPHGEGRYTYVNGSTAAGLVLYDNDTFAYSHHSTDPVGGRLVNAFDLVRIHKFGAQDVGATADTPTNRLASYKEMCEFAVTDIAVKEQLAESMRSGVEADFVVERNWRTRLEYRKDGNLASTAKNLKLIIENDEGLQGIAYNELKNEIALTSPLPWRETMTPWTDADDSSLRLYIEGLYGLWSPTKCADAFAAVVHGRSYHPIKEYLDSLPQWDGVKRIDTLLIDYLGAADNPYVRAVTRKTLTAAVARIYVPGIKFDTILTAVGRQGLGKSTLFSKLAGSWFSDALTVVDMNDKTGAEKLQGYWLLEVSELAGMRRTDVEVVKSFASKQRDIYRPAYGRRTQERPRGCVIVASTNTETGFLRDLTGNRRFWPVNVGVQCKTSNAWDLTPTLVAQIWAEAKTAFIDNETLFLDDPEILECTEKIQIAALEEDEREGAVREYLDTLLPENWADLGLNDRRAYLSGVDFGDGVRGNIKRTRVCVMEIWAECFKKDIANIQKKDSYEINAILRRIEEWEKYSGNEQGKLKFPIYGIQRCFVKKRSW